MEWSCLHRSSSLTAALAVFVGDGCCQQRHQWVEPMAPIIVIDGGVGGLCRRRSSLTEVAVGWSRRRQSLSLTAALAVFVNKEAALGWIQWWPCPALMALTQRSLASQSLLLMVVVNGGNGGMKLTAPIIIIDYGNGSHCRLRWWWVVVAAMAVFADNGRHWQRRQWDGADGMAPIVVVDGSGKDAIAAAAIDRLCR